MMLLDVKRAHFNAPARRRVFTQLPPEDPQYGLPEICAELVMSMYGTRDAAANWEAAYTELLLSIGFEKGVANPCHFLHRG